jgi:hypothetical protein
MRSDFINKRFIYSRRRTDGGSGGGGGGETEEFYEFHFLPEFDTFIWFDSANGGGNDRWNVELGSGSDSGRMVLPISPLNPWNDASDNTEVNGSGGPFGSVLSAPRTPARAVLGYKVTGLPEDATVVGAELRLTVNSKKNWD